MVKIEELSLQEKIGQMLMVGMDMPNIYEHIDDLILKYKVGGILLYRKNYKSYDELIQLINYIKKLNQSNKVPIFIAIDQEGGRVNRMPKEFKNIPSASKLAQEKSEETVKKYGKITAEMLSHVGINFNFAPVLDIKRFDDKHAIGDRAFSDNIEEISDFGKIIMNQLNKKDIISVIKHFPGHGSTNIDTHMWLPIVNKKIEKLEKEDMLPFENLIKDGADAVLVSHLIVSDSNKRLPVSMSKKFICKYLRKKYKYNKLIVTDDMRMSETQILYGKYFPIQKALLAGNDIVVFKYGYMSKTMEKIYTLLDNNKLKENRINKSVNRILKIKQKYNINDLEIEKDNNFVEKINQQI